MRTFNCKNCNKKVTVKNNRINAICCSTKCLGEYRKSQTPLNITCEICNKKFHKKKSHINSKIPDTCSSKCRNILDSRLMIGKGNHQYGLTGPKNASFKTGIRTSNYGYILIYKPEHKRANCNGYVFEHILIMEKHLGRSLKYIRHCHSDNEVIHHKDYIKSNNNLSNLKLMTHVTHNSMHAKQRKYTSVPYHREMYINYVIDGLTLKQLALKHNTTYSKVQRIIKKQRELQQ